MPSVVKLRSLADTDSSGGAALVAVFKGIHLCLPQTLWVEFLSQCEDISFIIWFSGQSCDSHSKGKTEIFIMFAFEFFSQILDIFLVYSIQFFFSFQKYKFFWNPTKIDVFTMFFPWNYFLCTRISSFLENGKNINFGPISKKNIFLKWE